MVNLDLLYKPVSVNQGNAGGRLIVVSNRVPVPSATGVPAAGGLAVALQSALRSRGGLVRLVGTRPAQDEGPAPQMRTLGPISFVVSDLTRRDIAEYYHGFANRTLWPICHYRLDLARHSEGDAAGYFRVNAFFARRLAKMLRADDIVWIHDYHFIPMASFLRQHGVKNRIGYFHHIPWPCPDTARAMPFYHRLLRAFGAYDVVGFQTEADAANFRACLTAAGAGRALDAAICASRRAQIRGRAPFRSASTPRLSRSRRASPSAICWSNACARASTARPMLIGVDRLDYSKGHSTSP